MKPNLKSSLALALAGFTALPGAAHADSEDAFCEVRRHGEPAKNATGYCTISQREGHVSIRLANGETVELEPGRHEGRFHDQDGKGVDHEIKQDGSHYYSWEHRNITVYFNRNEGIFN